MHVGSWPPEYDNLDFDEMDFLAESQRKAKARGFAILFMGSRLHSCDVIVLAANPFDFKAQKCQGPLRIVHAVEFTGDYVTDLLYLWKSLENMGNLESRFACLNTPSRWDCRRIGEA